MSLWYLVANTFTPPCHSMLSDHSSICTTWYFASTSTFASATISSYTALSAVLTLYNYMYPCYHHSHVNHAPEFQISSRHSFNIWRVTIYWAMVFWRQREYVYTPSRTSSIIASTRWGYFYQPYSLCFGCISFSQQATLWWKKTGSAQYGGLWPRSQSQTKLFLAQLVYRTCQRSGSTTTPEIKYRTSWPTSAGTSSSLKRPPPSHHIMR